MHNHTLTAMDRDYSPHSATTQEAGATQFPDNHFFKDLLPLKDLRRKCVMQIIETDNKFAPGDLFCFPYYQGDFMQLQKKLGYGFILFGLLLIIGLYFAADGGAYVFSVLLGVLAMCFGGFQLMLAKQLPARTAKPKTKKSRR